MHFSLNNKKAKTICNQKTYFCNFVAGNAGVVRGEWKSISHRVVGRHKTVAVILSLLLNSLSRSQYQRCS